MLESAKQKHFSSKRDDHDQDLLTSSNEMLEQGTMTAPNTCPQVGSSMPTIAMSFISGWASNNRSTCNALIL